MSAPPSPAASFPPLPPTAGPDPLEWVQVASDGTLCAVHFALPAGIAWVAWQRWRAAGRGDGGSAARPRLAAALPFPELLAAFAGVVFLCGLVHLADAAEVWLPVAHLAGVLKAVTAAAAVAAGALLFRNLPRLMALPDHEELSHQLRGERALMRAVIDASPHALFWKDTEGRYLGCNAVFPQYVGQSGPEGVVGKCDLDFGMQPNDAAHYRSDDRRVMDGSRHLLDIEEQIDRGDERRDLLTSKVPLRDADGVVCGVVGVFADVTDRKQAERERQKTLTELARTNAENRRLGLVARATRHSVIIADARGRAVWVNEAFTKLTGYTLDEVHGRKPGELLQGPDTDPAVKRRIGETLRRGESVSEEIVNYCKQGHGYPIRLEIDPVRDDAGAITDFVAIQTDLRSQKAHEAELTAAKEAAEASDRAKSAFLAHMSHEIRTPLNGILGFADLLRAGDADAERSAEYLDTIRTSGDHLLGLINDILDLSKIEAGRVEFEFARCDPHAVLCDVVSLMRVRAREKGVTLECRWSGPVPETIETDAGRLRQLLTNLVSNAVKFTATGGVRVLATVLGADGGAGSGADGGIPRLRIEVHDSGEGIPEHKLETIFEPFAQADASVTRRHGGTGLGLPIARAIAEGLGGGLTATSKPGWGSVFNAIVATGDLTGVGTYEPSDGDSVRDRTAPPPIAADAAPHLNGRRVLLVEDGEVNRRLICVALGRAGIEVEEAGDGRVGVDAARAAAAAGDPHDLILMDMQMPVLDGYGATRELREAGIETPVVALTAHAMDGDREKCLAAGCTDYLAKPIRPASLLAKLSAMLGGTPEPDTSQPETSQPETPKPADVVRGEDAPPPLSCGLPADDAELRAVAADFAAELPRRLEAARRARRAGDFGALAATAHTLRGTGGTMGYDCLTAPAADLEAAATLAAGEPGAPGDEPEPPAGAAALALIDDLLDDLTDLTARIGAGAAP